MLRDTGDRIASDDKSAIEAAIAEVRKAIESADAEAMNRGVQALT